MERNAESLDSAFRIARDPACSARDDRFEFCGVRALERGWGAKGLVLDIFLYRNIS